MEELVNMIGADASASEISDKIKDTLYARTAEKINAIRPSVGLSMFGDEQQSEDQE
jgi:hypothetical protein